MTAKIVVVMDTAAFKDAEDALFTGNMGDELARILRQVARYVSGKSYPDLTLKGWTLRDLNDLAVGQITIGEE